MEEKSEKNNFDSQKSVPNLEPFDKSCDRTESDEPLNEDLASYDINNANGEPKPVLSLYNDKVFSSKSKYCSDCSRQYDTDCDQHGKDRTLSISLEPMSVPDLMAVINNDSKHIRAINIKIDCPSCKTMLCVNIEIPFPKVKIGDKDKSSIEIDQTADHRSKDSTSDGARNDYLAALDLTIPSSKCDSSTQTDDIPDPVPDPELGITPRVTRNASKSKLPPKKSVPKKPEMFEKKERRSDKKNEPNNEEKIKLSVSTIIPPKNQQSRRTCRFKSRPSRSRLSNRKVAIDNSSESDSEDIPYDDRDDDDDDDDEDNETTMEEDNDDYDEDDESEEDKTVSMEETSKMADHDDDIEKKADTKEENVKKVEKIRIKIPKVTKPSSKQTESSTTLGGSCEFCGKHFKNKKNLRRHEKRHMNRMPSECGECGKTYSSQQALKQHQKLHSEPENESTLQDFIVKQEIEHDQELDVNNQELGAAEEHLDYDPILDINNQESASTSKIYRCEQCDDFQSPYQGNLARHKRDVHGGKNFYQCKQCSKTFKRMERLQIHEDNYHKDASQEAVMCNICGHMYPTLRSLTDHKRKCNPRFKKVKPDVLTCDICFKVFKHVPSLIRHKANTHDLTSDVSYACEVCGKRFATPYKLSSHKRCHSGQTFSCHCGKVFQYRRTLQFHQKSCVFDVMY